MKIDDYDFEALQQALGDMMLKDLAAWSVKLGLPGDPASSWTAVPGLVSVSVTAAAHNVAQTAGIGLDAATASLLKPAPAGVLIKQRSNGPRMNLARWRGNVRNK